MDKKVLTPELKQVYERVMNTPTRPQPQPPTTPVVQQIRPSAPPPPPSPSPPTVSSFSTVSPRPLKSSGNQPVVFSSQRKDSESLHPHTVIAGRSSSDIAKYTMIGFLVILFIATYTFVWMVVFKMVELPI